MAEKYPDAYVINPIRSLYDSGKINTQQFLMNCGGLNVDKSANRENFLQTNPKIRFIIVGMGLMSSGKSSGFRQARRYCSLLNSAAARRDWDTIESGNTSHDYNVSNNQNYKKRVRNLFRSAKYAPLSPWTEAGWKSMSKELKTQFSQDMYDIYYSIRHGTRITHADLRPNQPKSHTQVAENVRKSLTRDLNLRLEISGENRTNRKRRLQKEFIDQQALLSHNDPNRFSIEQKKKIKNIKSAGGSAVTYRNLRQAILDGKNIEYEAIGSSFSTMKTLFEVIVESTKNCREDYVYIVLGVLNLCSIQDSYNRQLCRFFHDSQWFIHSLEAAHSWNHTKPWMGITWGVQTQQQMQIIRVTPAPRLSLTTTTQQLNQDLYYNMKELIETCNKAIDAPTIYKGACIGFGIDILLVSHAAKATSEDTIIATLPLSIRSQNLIKSTSGESIRNRKFYHNLVIYILNKLLKINPYGKNPRIDTKINCDGGIEYNDTNDVNEIINQFQIDKQKNTARIKELSVLRTKGSQNVWRRSLKASKQGGRKKRRKTRRKRRKSRKKKRKKKTRKNSH